jgi:Flp pilus assembly protein TadD/arylsulfatase A-like enzyme
MSRRRSLVITAGLVVAAAAAGVVPVGRGRAVVLVAGDRALRVRVGPALAWRNPVTTRIVRLDLAPVSLEDGGSPELRLLARPDPEGDPQALRSIAADPAGALRAAAAAGRLATGAEADLSGSVERALEAGGWLAVEVVVVPPAATPAAADTGLSLLLVGVDSADWDRLDPLIAAGRAPNFARLRSAGAWGTLRSDIPSLSPLLWTTAATGRPPDQHGVIDFVMIDPATGAQVPISSRFRRVKAFWNILSDAGLTVAVVGWWATWPAEPVEGVLVTDRMAYSLFRFDGGGPHEGLTYPESYFAAAAALKLDPAATGLEQVRGLAAGIPEAEFRRSTERLRRPPEQAFEEPLDGLRRALASTLTYHRIALDLLHRGQPRLLAVYYEGLDVVNHRFAHLAPPDHPLGTAEERSRYGGTVDAFYELQDRLLGELLGAVREATVVFVLSDHGFANGAERPGDFPPFVEAGRPGRWHTRDGIWLLAGPPVRPGRVASPLRLVQVTPTILRLLGLPLADDMVGRPMEEALRESFLRRHPEGRVASHETGAAGPAPAPPGRGPADDEMLARLRSLGYLSSSAVDREGTSAGGTTANYHANLGAILLGRGDLPAAREAFGEALERSPGNLTARGGLIQIDILEGRPEVALEATLRMIQETSGFDPVFHAIAAQLFVRTGRVDEGLERFQALAREHPEAPEVHTGLGILLQHAGREQAAKGEYRRALDRRPDAVFALQELFSLEMPDGDLADLLRRLRAAIDAAPQTVMAYNWRGLVLRRLGHEAEAERSFREALRLDPGGVRTLVNLSALLVDAGRTDEAIPLLRRAREADPGALEARINLVVALGRAGRLDEARAEFEAAGGEASGSKDLLNAMAFASYLNDAAEEARALLERSLALDPEQPEARRLLGRVGGHG